LQSEYEDIIKSNKEKQVFLQKLKKKKDLQESLLMENDKKIEDLEAICENTKTKA